MKPLLSSASFGIVAATVLALPIVSPSDANACGGFFRRRVTQTIPSLEVEQVLIVHDPVTEEEQFIRELVFRDAKDPFGFVVPTPSQPTVAKVERSPFAALAQRFPPEPPEPPATGGPAPKGGMSRGAGGGAAATVTVLSQERIGSFTAFVLAATDAGALKKWLDENELATTPESDAWLEHYVKLGFYFAAFRYEATAPKAGPSSRAETVRLTFKTPLPYYPYREPKHAKEPAKHDRVLSVWLASPVRSTPVAAVEEVGVTRWKRPWRESNTHAPTTSGTVGAIVGAGNMGALGQPASSTGDAREAPLSVQTFQDQKTSRRGWGDVVLVPERPYTSDDARLARMNKLMATLDFAIGDVR